MAYQTWWRPLHVEALIATGDLSSAAPALADLVAASREARRCAGRGMAAGRLAQVHGDTGRA
ncbi:hypothetical protein [Streptomyces cadmiisoli]|uniref:hypothetical protein n=1 Tax=Streptomyces cadmiisoli TaxID=2184053 RepID=UPI003D74F4F3